MHRWLKILPPFAVIVVAVASFALSYVALRDVSAEVGAVPGPMAWLVPIVIDGGVIGGSAVIWAQASDGARRRVFPFLFVGALVIVSVVVNVNHADDNLLAMAIAALPPLVLLGALELAAGQLKRARTLADVAETEAAARVAAEQESADRLAAAEADAADTARRAAELEARLEEADRQRAAERDELTADFEQQLAERDAAIAQQLAERDAAVAQAEETAAEAKARAAEADARATEAAAHARDAVAAASSNGKASSTGRASTNGQATGAGKAAGKVNGAATAKAPATRPAAASSDAPAATDAPAEDAAGSGDADTATASPLLQAALDTIDGVADLPVREAVGQVYERFVATGGDPMDRTLAADLALALGSTPGYIRNVLRDQRN